MLYLHHRLLQATGGAPGLRDLGLLESAIARPRASAGGRDAYPGILDKAAALMHSLILNHPFIDGNKRAGFAAAVLFLQMNGHRLSVDRYETVDFCVRVAQGEIEVLEIAGWFASRRTPNSQ